MIGGIERTLILTDGIEVFRAHCEAWSGHEAEALLGPMERSRLVRFRHLRDRHRYAARWAAARTVLGYFSGCNPSDLRFEQGPWGKPRLVHPAGTGLGFNLSASGDLSVIAVRRGGEVGVDIEATHPEIDPLTLATSLAPEEAALLRAKRNEERAAWFIHLWTCREATLKCAGQGLSIPPSSLRVDESLEWASGRGALAGRRWRVQPFSPAAGHIGAVAIEHKTRR